MSINNWIAERFNKTSPSIEELSPSVVSRSTKEIIAEEIALQKAVKEDDWAILAEDHRGAADVLDHTYHSINSDISPKYNKAMFSGINSISKEKNPDGVSKKLVHKIDDDTFMTKAYSANRTTQTVRAEDIPLAGWAIMTSKNLYHAAGLKDLCEDVGTKLSKTKGSQEEIPTTVHKFSKGYIPVREALDRDAPNKDIARSNTHDRLQARQIGVMDFLTGNEDRHGGNLMISMDSREDGKRNLLAIDHDNSFIYRDQSMYDSYSRSAMHGYLKDSILQKKEADGLASWWTKSKGSLLDEMNNNLNSVKDRSTRIHLRENFTNRHNHISKWAEAHLKGEDTEGVHWPKGKVVEAHKFGQVGKQDIKTIKDSLPDNKEAALEMLMDLSKKSPSDGGHGEHIFAVKTVAMELLDDMPPSDVIRFFGRNHHENRINAIKKDIIDIMIENHDKHRFNLISILEANKALPKESKFLNEFQSMAIRKRIERKRQEGIATVPVHQEIKEVG